MILIFFCFKDMALAFSLHNLPKVVITYTTVCPHVPLVFCVPVLLCCLSVHLSLYTSGSFSIRLAIYPFTSTIINSPVCLGVHPPPICISSFLYMLSASLSFYTISAFRSNYLSVRGPVYLSIFYPKSVHDN